MCGIAGFIDTAHTMDAGTLEAAARRMADTLHHRGPDDGGAWVDAEAGAALGFRRLAIIDLSTEGRQPMLSACGRYVIVFNGEIYNFPALRAELEKLGQTFRGHSDTEVLLAAVSRWGIDAAIARANGMFALALWDRQTRRLHLVRDRLGIKPLYYGWMGKTFLFGSELKALRAHPAFAGQIDPGALALYLRFQYVPSPGCIYAGLRKLPPGTILTLDAERAAPGALLDLVPYWALRAAAERGASDPFAGTEADAIDQLDALLRDAVRVRMIADVPLGAFLSGGIDSSTVVALMQAQSAPPVRTFTIGMHEAGYDEAADARRVAAHLGADHTELYLTPAEARAVIPRLPALYDEPFADASQIPTFLVSQLTRRYVTVSLSGDGGDEVFGGYNRYTWAPAIWRRVGGIPAAARRAAARALTMLPAPVWDALFATAAPVLPGRFRQRMPGDRLHKLAGVLAAGSREAMYLGLASTWQEPADLINTREPPSPLIDRAQWADLPDFTQQMMYLDTMTYLPDDILTKVDRASMGVSLEARVPLLDYRVVEFAWRLPLALKIRGPESKWALRRVLDRYVPAALVERPKAGFAVPIDAWLRGPLRAWAEDLLRRDDGYLNPAPVRARLAEHLAGRRNWQYCLWNVLMFRAWLDAQ